MKNTSHSFSVRRSTYSGFTRVRCPDANYTDSMTLTDARFEAWLNHTRSMGHTVTVRYY
jgi:hypothetical protein